MVKGARRNRAIMPPRVNVFRCSITADSGTKASFSSEPREAVARIPSVCQSSLNTSPGVSRGGMKKVMIVSPSGPSAQVASAKKKSRATLCVPKILRPVTNQPPSTRRAVARGRKTGTALSGSDPEPPQMSRPAAIWRSLASTFGSRNVRQKSTSNPTTLRCMLIASAVAPHPWARRSWALIRCNMLAPNPPNSSGMVSRV